MDRFLTELVNVPAGSTAGVPADVASEMDLLWVAMSIAGLAMVFHAVYVVCDEHLVPGIAAC